MVALPDSLVKSQLEHQFEVYCDESSTKSGRYMLIGSLWVPRISLLPLRQRIATLRDQYDLRRELKWQRVSPTFYAQYRDFVDILYRDPNVYFKCIVVDRHIVDWKTYHQGDKELGFYKFYYLLVSRTLQATKRYWLYTDYLSTRDPYRLTDLHNCVNNWCSNHIYARPLRLIEPRDSKKEDLIQLVDVLLGAVGYAWNEYGENATRLDLIRHIAQRNGRKTLRYSSASSERKFNIWEWKP